MGEERANGDVPRREHPPVGYLLMQPSQTKILEGGTKDEMRISNEALVGRRNKR